LRAIGAKRFGNKTLTKYHGEDALMLLWLVCLQASAWRVEGADNRNNVYRALERVRKGLDPEPSSMPETSDEVARELFFLIRNLITNDPHAEGFGGCAAAPIVFEKVIQAHGGHASRRKSSTQLSNEPFLSAVTRKFYSVYQIAERRGDLALLEEVRGPIWRQLHL
jgi:hypothetical protein